MSKIIELAKQNIQRDFSFEGNNYFCDIDSDDTLFITVERGNDWDILIDGIEM